MQFITRMSWQGKILALALAIAAVALAVAVPVAAGIPSSAPPASPTPFPMPPYPPTLPDPSVYIEYQRELTRKAHEEYLKLSPQERQEIELAKALASEKRIAESRVPSTAGATFTTAAGYEIQLSPDVYKMGSRMGLCVVGTKCFPNTFYVLQKGQSIFRIANDTNVYDMQEAPGEKGAFDVLVEQLTAKGFVRFDPLAVAVPVAAGIPSSAPPAPPTPFPIPPRPSFNPPRPDPSVYIERQRELQRKAHQEYLKLSPQERREKQLAETQARDKRIAEHRGPSTAGATFTTAAGYEIQLPPDVYITGIVSGHCVVGAKCFPSPLYGLQKGQSFFRIANGTNVYDLHEAPGEEGAFDVLVEQLTAKGFVRFDPLAVAVPVAAGIPSSAPPASPTPFPMPPRPSFNPPRPDPSVYIKYQRELQRKAHEEYLKLSPQERQQNQLAETLASEKRIAESRVPSTAGATFTTAAGYEIQLPPDVYKRGSPTVDCIVGTKCFPNPFHVLQKGQSFFWIASDTNVYDMREAPGEEGAFDVLVEQLTAKGFVRFDRN